MHPLISFNRVYLQCTVNECSLTCYSEQGGNAAYAGGHPEQRPHGVASNLGRVARLPAGLSAVAVRPTYLLFWKVTCPIRRRSNKHIPYIAHLASYILMLLNRRS